MDILAIAEFVEPRGRPLQPAEGELEINTMAAAADISLPPTAPLLLFARKLNVLIWPLRRAE